MFIVERCSSQLAAHRGFTQILAILVRHGANLDVKDNGGSTSLELAVNNGHDATADYIRKVRRAHADKSNTDVLNRCIESSEPGSIGHDYELVAQNQVDSSMYRDPSAISGIVSSLTTYTEAVQKSTGLCGICFEAIGSGELKLVRASDEFCRFCNLVRHSRSPIDSSTLKFGRQSNQTHVDFSGQSGSEVSCQVRKLPGMLNLVTTIRPTCITTT